MKRSNIHRVSIFGAAALAFSVLLPAPASAAASDEPTISGYTKAEFVAAAGAEGVDSAVANHAWGDLDAMASIPVSSDSNEGFHEAEVSTLRAAAHSGSCFKTWNNLWGFEILRVTINKTWSTTSAGKVSAPSAQFYGRAGIPYVFDGVVNSNDYYAGSNTIHTTYRQGKFSESLSGTAVNASATFNARSYGAYGCTFGGGV